MTTTLDARKLGKQLEKASKEGVRFAVIAGAEEGARGMVKLRDLALGGARGGDGGAGGDDPRAALPGPSGHLARARLAGGVASAHGLAHAAVRAVGGEVHARVVAAGGEGGVPALVTPSCSRACR